jgi:hypothetical protein
LADNLEIFQSASKKIKAWKEAFHVMIPAEQSVDTFK